MQVDRFGQNPTAAQGRAHEAPFPAVLTAHTDLAELLAVKPP